MGELCRGRRVSDIRKGVKAAVGLACEGSIVAEM